MLLSECWQQRAKKKEKKLCALNSVYSSFFCSQYCSHKGSLSICRSQSTRGETPPILLEAVKHAWQRWNISASESQSHTSAPTGGAANASTNKPIRLYYDLSMPRLSFFQSHPYQSSGRQSLRRDVIASPRCLSLTVCFITGRLEKVHNHLNSHLKAIHWWNVSLSGGGNALTLVRLETDPLIGRFFGILTQLASVSVCAHKASKRKR